MFSITRNFLLGVSDFAAQGNYKTSQKNMLVNVAISLETNIPQSLDMLSYHH